MGDAIWTESSVRSVLGKSNNMKVLEMREGEKMSPDWQSSQNATGCKQMHGGGGQGPARDLGNKPMP